MHVIARWIVSVLAAILGCLALFVAIANIAHTESGDARNTAFGTGGAGGALLVVAVLLLVFKADAVAGLVFVFAAAITFSAALFLNHAESKTWEPFSWMYVIQSVAAIAIGSPAIWISWTDIIRPALHTPGSRWPIGTMPRVIAILAFVVATIGLAFGNYTYSVSGTDHDRSGDRIGFVIWTLLGIGFLAGSFKNKWVAIGSCVVAGLGLFMFITYPLTMSVSYFWGQALALPCYIVALIASIGITRVKKSAAQDKP